jgi:hypothetical protein
MGHLELLSWPISDSSRFVFTVRNSTGVLQPKQDKHVAPSGLVWWLACLSIGRRHSNSDRFSAVSRRRAKRAPAAPAL